MLYNAIETVGREVLLIRDNKVIGEGWSSAMYKGMVSIEMRDDRAKALVENSSVIKAWGESFPEKKFKYGTFKFFAFDGSYADDEDDRYFEDLEDIRVVDKFNFKYGMVPETFKDVEGYLSVRSEYQTEENKMTLDKTIVTANYGMPVPMTIKMTAEKAAVLQATLSLASQIGNLPEKNKAEALELRELLLEAIHQYHITAAQAEDRNVGLEAYEPESAEESNSQEVECKPVRKDPATEYTDRTGRHLSLEERMQERRPQSSASDDFSF